MTVKELLDWYQYLIDDFAKDAESFHKEGDTESEAFHKGMVFGLDLAYIALNRQRKEGLDGDD